MKRNLDSVKEDIEIAARGREITLVCVTKYVNAEIASALVDVGAENLGENRIVEGAEKFDSLRHLNRKFTAHNIGSVQSNKANKIPGAFDWCQSLCSEKVAGILDRTCSSLNQNLNVTIEVNIGSEIQKDGVLASDVSKLVAFVVNNCPNLNLRGLMCIQPIANEIETRRYFSKMRVLFEQLKTQSIDSLNNWNTLSMGMSTDFVWAIEEGATMVRVGSRLYDGVGEFIGVH